MTYFALCLLTLLSLLVGTILVEASYRVTSGLPLLSLADWRRERVTLARFGERAVYDTVLGWRLRSGYSSDDFNTIQYGIRRNFKETQVRTGGVLAVGDSFTEGWDEVHDAETWPAHLERLINQAVVNGGVGGYGTDQIILRAEQLLSVVKPDTLIVGFNEIDIFRSGHAPYGGPKPYFTMDNGNLRFHAPQPLELRDQSGLLMQLNYQIRDILGHFAVADAILKRIALDYWYGDTGEVYRKVDNDEVAVTCALLQRLKRTADERRIRVLLFMQYYGDFILETDEISENARKVEGCARAANLEVVDQFESMRKIAVASPKALREYYVIQEGQFQHMSSKGNAHAAELLATRLRRKTSLSFPPQRKIGN